MQPNGLNLRNRASIKQLDKICRHFCGGVTRTEHQRGPHWIGFSHKALQWWWSRYQAVRGPAKFSEDENCRETHLHLWHCLSGNCGSFHQGLAAFSSSQQRTQILGIQWGRPAGPHHSEYSGSTTSSVNGLLKSWEVAHPFLIFVHNAGPSPFHPLVVQPHLLIRTTLNLDDLETSEIIGYLNTRKIWNFSDFIYDRMRCLGLIHIFQIDGLILDGC